MVKSITLKGKVKTALSIALLILPALALGQQKLGGWMKRYDIANKDSILTFKADTISSLSVPQSNGAKIKIIPLLKGSFVKHTMPSGSKYVLCLTIKSNVDIVTSHNNVVILNTSIKPLSINWSRDSFTFKQGEDIYWIEPITDEQFDVLKKASITSIEFKYGDVNKKIDIDRNMEDRLAERLKQL